MKHKQPGEQVDNAYTRIFENYTYARKTQSHSLNTDNEEDNDGDLEGTRRLDEQYW